MQKSSHEIRPLLRLSAKAYLDSAVTVYAAKIDSFRNEVSLNFEDERTHVPSSSTSTVQSLSLYAMTSHLTRAVYALVTAKKQTLEVRLEDVCWTPMKQVWLITTW